MGGDAEKRIMMIVWDGGEFGGWGVNACKGSMQDMGNSNGIQGIGV
jgi:hypothetical protein